MLLIAHVRVGQSGVGGNDIDQAVRGVARQSDLVDALPNTNPLFGSLQARALFRQVRAAAFRGFGLLMHQPRPEIHHGIFAGLRLGATHGRHWFKRVHALLLRFNRGR